MHRGQPAIAFSGISATIEHRVNRPGDASAAVSVAECVHHYIGAMDTLKLNMSAKDGDFTLSFRLLGHLPQSAPTSGRIW